MRVTKRDCETRGSDKKPAEGIRRMTAGKQGEQAKKGRQRMTGKELEGHEESRKGVVLKSTKY